MVAKTTKKTAPRKKTTGRASMAASEQKAATAARKLDLVALAARGKVVVSVKTDTPLVAGESLHKASFRSLVAQGLIEPADELTLDGVSYTRYLPTTNGYRLLHEVSAEPLARETSAAVANGAVPA